jgi:hypothetical protein
MGCDEMGQQHDTWAAAGWWSTARMDWRRGLAMGATAASDRAQCNGASARGQHNKAKADSSVKLAERLISPPIAPG